MKTLVLMHHANDLRPVVISSDLELTYRTHMFLVDKWRQQFDILCGHDKVLDETFYAVTIYDNSYHAPSLEDLIQELREYHDINVIQPFEY